MNRSGISLLVFLLTFGFGYILAPNYIRFEPPEVQIAISSETTGSKAATGLNFDDFDPEFTDLTDFVDLNLPEPSRLDFKLIDILMFGNEFSKDELPAKNGETWLALFEENGRMELRPTKIRVTVDRTSNKQLNGDNFKVTNDRSIEPVFMIRGSKSLKPGRINSLFLGSKWEEIENGKGEPETMSVGYRREFDLHGNVFVLRVTNGLTRSGEKVNVLVLESNNVQQIVTYNEYFKDAFSNYNMIGDLIWAGDLDRDGRLDIYFSNFGYEKGGFGSTLYLSSKAKKGQLVGIAATFFGGGC
jgi:hypothetical protein